MIKKKLRVSLTNKCNFKCTYCWSGGEGLSCSRKNLSQEELIFIINYLAQNYMFSFIRLTGGEPLLRKDLYEIVKKMQETKTFDKITMVSNGSLINSQVAGELAELNFKSITISLDTLKREVFKKVTGVDYFDKVCDAIKYLKNNGVNVKINSVITRENYNEVFDLINFASSLNVPIKLLDYIVYDENDLKNNYQPFAEIKHKLRETAFKFEIQNQDEGFGIPEEVYHIDNTTVVVKDSSLGTCYTSNLCNKCEKYPCQSGIVSFVLSNDGVLSLCSNKKYIIDLKPLLHNDLDTIKQVETLINNYECSSFLQAWDKKTDNASKLSSEKIMSEV